MKCKKWVAVSFLVFILILDIETRLPCRQGGQRRFRHCNVSDQSHAWDSYLSWTSTVDDDDAAAAAGDDDDDGDHEDDDADAAAAADVDKP